MKEMSGKISRKNKMMNKINVINMNKIMSKMNKNDEINQQHKGND